MLPHLAIDCRFIPRQSFCMVIALLTYYFKF
nr:MAG TPA: hypothetical protein [Caudoviricetes sp.]